jgi:hypothetical protein
LGWTGRNLVVILESQQEHEETWKSMGWDVVLAKDDWAPLVIARLTNGGASE